MELDARSDSGYFPGMQYNLDNRTVPPRISVIIPAYNRARLLAEAIDSVLAQTHSDFELIVVDDGSTDDTPSLLDGYGAGIRVFRQVNRGVSAARNEGIRMARGELIAFLDSDDLWLPEKLSAQTAFFNAHPESRICQTEEIWIRNGVRVNPRRRHRKPTGDIFLPSLQLCLVSPSAVMLRRELFQEIGLFDESLPACEDYDLWLRVSRLYPVHLVETPLVVKRGGHADQLSKKPGLDRYRVQSLAKLLRDTDLGTERKAAVLQTLQRKCAVYAAGCRKRGRADEADRYEAMARQSWHSDLDSKFVNKDYLPEPANRAARDATCLP